MPGNPDVGDVLQETNVVLWQKRTRFKKDTNFLAWAFSIARYEVMHHRDRTKRGGWLVFSDELIDRLAEEQPADVGKSHERFLQALDACLGRLPVNQRDLIECRYMSDQSVEQYAQTTGKSSGSLRVALLRIRKALKLCIEKSLEGGAA